MFNKGNFSARPSFGLVLGRAMGHNQTSKIMNEAAKNMDTLYLINKMQQWEGGTTYTSSQLAKMAKAKGYNLGMLDRQASKLTEDDIEQMLEGEESETNRMVKRLGVKELHNFVMDMFDEI